MVDIRWWLILRPQGEEPIPGWDLLPQQMQMAGAVRSRYALCQGTFTSHIACKCCWHHCQDTCGTMIWWMCSTSNAFYPISCCSFGVICVYVCVCVQGCTCFHMCCVCYVDSSEWGGIIVCTGCVPGTLLSTLCDVVSAGQRWRGICTGSHSHRHPGVWGLEQDRSLLLVNKPNLPLTIYLLFKTTILQTLMDLVFVLMSICMALCIIQAQNHSSGL